MALAKHTTIITKEKAWKGHQKKNRAHVEVQENTTQNARGKGLFLGRGGHTFDQLNPRQSVKRDCKGELSKRGLGRLNSLCRIPIILR